MINQNLAFAKSAGRKNALSVCMATIFGLTLHTAHATTFVTNCNDSGLGSLRASVVAAGQGDTVDMRGLTKDSPGCAQSKITLTTGDIPVGRDDLFIEGPGEEFVVSGFNSIYSVEPHRIFTHTGYGEFAIRNLSMNEGYAVGTGAAANGGCISSTGSVYLINVTVALCYAKATSGNSLGGAIYSKGGVYLDHSTIILNHADGPVGSTSRGGAIAIFGGGFYSFYSNIAGNSSGAPGRADGRGGAVETSSSAACLLENTTVSGNHAATVDGGLGLFCTETEIVDSTISGNSAPTNGGAYFRSPKIELYNSTVAFNQSTSASASPGLRLAINGGTKGPVMYSVLVSNNAYGPTHLPNDLISPPVVGSNNLIFAPASSVPADTLVGKCPLLAPLANNGGVTQTHALRSRSPAIDVGNNIIALNTDQRGRPFSRESGPADSQTPHADIGAYELDRAAIIFSGGFDGCP
jgi:hypothetical protein